MSIEFVETKTENGLTSCDAVLDGTKVGVIVFDKDYIPYDGFTIVKDPERKFCIHQIERTDAGRELITHKQLCEEFYQYMHSLGYGMAVTVYYWGEVEGEEKNGLSLYDYYDQHWDRYEIYARKLGDVGQNKE